MPPKGRILSTEPIPVNGLLSWLTVRCQCPPSKAIQIASQLIKKGVNSEKGIYDLEQVWWQEWVDSRDLCARIKRQARLGMQGGAGGSSSTSPVKPTTPKGKDVKKRKREDEVVDDDYADFREQLEEKSLFGRSVMVNRAPVMLAWSTIFAQQIGFSLEEALSIGGCYTSSNAKSKGRAIGLEKRDRPYEENLARHGPSQPFITFMNRHIPILLLQNEEYRAVEEGGKVVEPKASYDYLKRSFRQSLRGVLSAMKLLATSLDAQELQDNGSLAFGLYVDFRPEGQGWGERSEIKLDTILGLRGRQRGGRLSSPGASSPSKTAADVKDDGPVKSEDTGTLVQAEESKESVKEGSPDYEELDDSFLEHLL